MTGADELDALVAQVNIMIDAELGPCALDDSHRHILIRQCIEGGALARAAALLADDSFAVAHDLILLAARLAASMALQEAQDPANRESMDRIMAALATPTSVTVPHPTRAPDVDDVVFDEVRHEFVVKFAGGRIERFAGARFGDDIAKYEVDEFRRGVVVHLGDGSETSFSGDLVLYEADPAFRERVDQATRERAARGAMTEAEIDALAADHPISQPEPASED